MGKPRVMQLVLSLAAGGTERLVIEICKRLAARIEWTVCCLDDKGAWAAELEALGIPVIALGRQPGFQPALARDVAAIMKRRRIDVVHCHQYSPYVYGLMASIMAGTRLVFTEHGRISSTPRKKRQLVNPILSLLPGQIFAVSADLKRHMVDEGFPARCIRVVHNGIDPGERTTPAARRAMRTALGIPDDAFVVGTAGRLVPVKNVPAMLETHALLRERIAATQLLIVGDGPERAALEQQAADLGLAGSARFLGYRADVRDVMAAFDVYLNASLYEGVSLTILEAMACGLPVVATPVGGNAEVVVDQETGYVMPSEPRLMADTLAHLAVDARLRSGMGDAARWRLIRHFSMARMVDEYAAIYFADRRPRVSAAPTAAPTAAEATSASEPTRSSV